MDNLMKKIGVGIGFLCLSCVFLLGVAKANIFDIEYPVLELGNCDSQKECKIFCDKEENQIACVNFAESKNIIPREYAQQTRNDLKRFEEKLDDFGPGGCITPKECDAYCRVLGNLDECLDYGVAHGHQSQTEADTIREQAKKGGPGGCQSREECDDFCHRPENSQECFSFVVKEGKITQEEADFMTERMRNEKERHQPKSADIDEEKARAILETIGGPGGCRTPDECDKYCMGFEHGAECLEFAIKHELIKPDDLERVKRLSSVKSGPGGCLNDKECQIFCSKPGNQEECMRFMRENKIVSEEELQMMEKEMEIMLKLGGPGGPGGPGGMDGPGGCRGPEECDAYCSDSAHIEECINFAGQPGQQNGMMDKRIIDNMMGQTQEARDKMMQIEMERKKFENGEGDLMMMDGKMMEMKKTDFENRQDGPMMIDRLQPIMEGTEKMQMMPYQNQMQIMEGMPNMSEDKMRKEFEVKIMEKIMQMQMQMPNEVRDFSDGDMMKQMPPDGEMYQEFEMGPPTMEQTQFIKDGMINSEYPPEFFQQEIPQTGAKVNGMDLLGSIIAPFLNGFLGR